MAAKIGHSDIFYHSEAAAEAECAAAEWLTPERCEPATGWLLIQSLGRVKRANFVGNKATRDVRIGHTSFFASIPTCASVELSALA